MNCEPLPCTVLTELYSTRTNQLTSIENAFYAVGLTNLPYSTSKTMMPLRSATRIVALPFSHCQFAPSRAISTQTTQAMAKLQVFLEGYRQVKYVAMDDLRISAADIGVSSYSVIVAVRLNSHPFR